ncbi:MAG TPA: alcohol dehydrogenase catalytic domain-containing protein [Acidimicrobiales bacterium]|nr:alcohol dehydrogenase catalytic domain-containing protein [Acidimicrobiales bacterium]
MDPPGRGRAGPGNPLRGVFLPGARRVDIKDVDDPRPGHGQVVIAMRASSICGSDLRAIYREHLGTGPEAYKDVVAGHEPSGEVVDVGPGCRQLKVGDRVVIYHIAGCGLCDDCRAGYFISCTSPRRAAYGWQRDGGHANYLLAEETTCIALPDELTFLDGACVACGFGTAYEALIRLSVSGRDAVLVTGLGPVGLAAALLAKALGASLVIGLDIAPARRDLAMKLDAVDVGLIAGSEAIDEIRDLTNGRGCEASVDCSGSPAGRLLALGGTRRRGRCALVGEGTSLTLDVSHDLIHRDLTVLGSWVTSIGRMTELTQNLPRWGLHPERIVTSRYGLDQADAAYATADAGEGGKVAIVM